MTKNLVPTDFENIQKVTRGNIYRDTSGSRESTGSSYSFFNPSNYYSDH